jgi:hypothetical protein
MPTTTRKTTGATVLVSSASDPLPSASADFAGAAGAD